MQEYKHGSMTLTDDTLLGHYGISCLSELDQLAHFIPWSPSIAAEPIRSKRTLKTLLETISTTNYSFTYSNGGAEQTGGEAGPVRLYLAWCPSLQKPNDRHSLS